MTRKKTAKPTPESILPPGESLPPNHGEIVPISGMTNMAISEFSAERDALLQGALPDSAMPENEEAFYARDPFSADYADFLKEKANQRRGDTPRVNGELRADMLARPHLMERPEESAHRGAAAVWRSLRDQLHGNSQAILDSSGREEILLLQRDLETRKALVASVGKGIDALLKRLDQRLAALDAAPKSGE